MEVRDLFYNTPARRKFLKAERTEVSQIDQMLRRLSLAHMDVGFSLAQARTTGNSGRVNRPLMLAAGDPLDRLSRVVSPDFVENSIYIDESNHDLRLYGWVDFPPQSSSIGSAVLLCQRPRHTRQAGGPCDSAGIQ